MGYRSRNVLLMMAAGVCIVLIGWKAISLWSDRSSLFKEAQTPGETSQSLTCEQTYETLVAQNAQDYAACLKDPGLLGQNCQGPDQFSDQYKENLNILLILDASGSMAESIAGGQKMAIAKQVITDFISSVPQRANVGLMVYGHKGSNSERDKQLSCSGIEMVYPISTLDKSRLTEAITAFDSTGWTPIAASLQQAKTILASSDPQTTTNIIYVVSDGIETCDGDPVAAAEELHALNVQTIVNIVGLSVDSPAQQQLRAAARAGGGDYYQANTADEMRKVFEDRKKYLQGLLEERECVQENLTTNRRAIQKELTETRDCIQDKAKKQFLEGVQKEARELRRDNTIDASCYELIHEKAGNRYHELHDKAWSEWNELYNAAHSNWVEKYNQVHKEWTEETNKR